MNSIELLRSDLRLSREIGLELDDVRFAEPVALVDEHLSSLGADYFFEKANNPFVDRRTGMKYGLADSEPEMRDNVDSLIVMPSTFANGAWPHMFARAEAIAKLHSIETGVPTSVLLTAAPSMESKFGLSERELERARKGHYKPVADRHLRLVTGLGFSQLEGIVAYSGPTVFATHLALGAKRELDGSGNVFIGEPPHEDKSNVLSEAVRFLLEGIPFKKAIQDENIAVINEIFASGQASPDFLKGIFKQSEENLAIARGFGQGKLMKDLTTLGSNGICGVVMHGSDSKVSRSKPVQNAVREANDRIVHADDGIFAKRIEVFGARHSFGDRVGRMATLAVTSLTV